MQSADCAAGVYEFEHHLPVFRFKIANCIYKTSPRVGAGKRCTVMGVNPARLGLLLAARYTRARPGRITRPRPSKGLRRLR